MSTNVYGFMPSTMPPPSENLIKISVSFRSADLRKLNSLTEEFVRQGLSVRRGTVLRALMELPSEKEMVLRALLARDGFIQDPAAEAEAIADTPTVDVPARLLEKVGRVVAELRNQGLDTKRSGVVRSILQTVPAAGEWGPLMAKFLRDFPRKPRSDRKERP